MNCLPGFAADADETSAQVRRCRPAVPGPRQTTVGLAHAGSGLLQYRLGPAPACWRRHRLPEIKNSQMAVLAASPDWVVPWRARATHMGDAAGAASLLRFRLMMFGIEGAGPPPEQG